MGRRVRRIKWDFCILQLQELMGGDVADLLTHGWEEYDHKKHADCAAVNHIT